eukprot:COSAG02_NODE_4340_length_5485_cov_2.496101_6_plen_329_part_00
MSALMLGMGIFQGPMSPVQSQISRDWMKEGVERAWAYRLLSLSHSSTPLLAAIMTPRLASRFGWRFVCYMYATVAGAFTGIWLLLAGDSPGGRKNVGGAAAAKKPTRPAFDWRIMRTKPGLSQLSLCLCVSSSARAQQLRLHFGVLYFPALALAAFHIAADFGEFTRHQLAPTMYMEKFSCTPVEMVGASQLATTVASRVDKPISDPVAWCGLQGSYLAIGNAMHIPAGFVWAAIESYLVKRGVNVLTMRRSFTGIASVMETILQVLYGLAPSPLIATIYYGLIDAFFTMHTGPCSVELEPAAIAVPICLNSACDLRWCMGQLFGSGR